MHIDERLPVTTYLRQTFYTIDGLSWLITCIAAALCLLDVIFALSILPLRDAFDPSKAVVLLLFSPLLVFLVMVCFRQLPFAGNKAAVWFRAAICIFVFLTINF